MTVFVWLLWSYFHFEVNKNGTFRVTKKGGLDLFCFSSSPSSPNVCVYFLQKYCIYSCSFTADLLLVFFHLEAPQLMYFSCSSCFVFPNALAGSPCCEKLYDYVCIRYICVYIYICSLFCFFHFTEEVTEDIISISEGRWRSSVSAPGHIININGLRSNRQRIIEIRSVLNRR